MPNAYSKNLKNFNFNKPYFKISYYAGYRLHKHK
jgi:hypothetical protein